MNRRQFLGTAAVGTPLVAGCTDDGSGDSGGGTAEETATPTSTADGSDVTVVMRETTFQTLRAEVPTGATVTWVNEDSHDHDVTAAQFHDSAADWSFSETLSGDESTTHTFERAGIYEYYCTLHSKSLMCGTVLVGDVTLDESLPCEVADDDGAY